MSLKLPLNLKQWQILHGVSDLAMIDLMSMFGVTQHSPTSTRSKPLSESAVQAYSQLDYAKAGDILWRNNVGVLMDARNIPVRYGLANESKKMNEEVKSSDLIGITRVLITPEMVGTTIGQFTAIETKKQAWKWSGNAHEVAQLKFHQIVVSYGGKANFYNGVDK